MTKLKDSAVYRLCTGMYHRLSWLIRDSFCARLWQGPTALTGRAENSAFFHFFDKFLSYLSNLVQNSFILSFLCKLNPAILFGAVLLACYLCPGSFWRNQYALVLSIVLFAVALGQSRQPFRARDLGLGFLGFGLACVVGVGVSADIGEGLRVFCFYATAFALCMAIVGAINTPGRLHTLLGFLYATLLITGLTAFIQRIIGVAPNASLTDLTVNTGMPGRVYSTMENPNNFAELIVLFFPLGLAWCCLQKGRKKPLALAGLLIPLGALLMTYSRSGWVSFALAAVVFIALYDKRLLLILGVAVVLLFPVLPDSIFNRILTIGSTADSSNMYRVYIWKAVLQMLKDYGLTGIGLGPGNFTPVYAQYCLAEASVASHSHMLYLEVWLEMGILGLVGFFGMYLGTIRRGLRAMKQTGPQLRLPLAACVSSLCGIAFSCAVEYVWYYPRIMFAFFIILGITLASAKMAGQTE